ncbi:Non-specific phospholipase C1 [Ananas comosus]|uniref:Non-specific phospholipase C1 n=1 Tax=Ananas comosus TaxID=4615 RepID=A0A199VNA4_ANACO|nr:Non-specific phospholipase C1 [Ananas comosus]
MGTLLRPRARLAQQVGAPTSTGSAGASPTASTRRTPPPRDLRVGRRRVRGLGPGPLFQASRADLRVRRHLRRPGPMSASRSSREHGEAWPDRHVRLQPRLRPIYTALADQFAVFDRWFASVPTPPANRFYVHSATSHGCSSNVRKDLIHGFPEDIFDSLDGTASASASTTRLPQLQAHLQAPRQMGQAPQLRRHRAALHGPRALPANDDHRPTTSPRPEPDQGDLRDLRASPQWNETALIITYDEHGGFYDHVPTRWPFDRLESSARSSSPMDEKGTATVKKLFNLNSNFLTKRDAWAGTFEKYFSVRKEPRTDCPEKLPEVVKSLRPYGPKEDSTLSEFQVELIQLASQLNGDHVLNTYPDIGKGMTVIEANRYAEDAVARFLEAGRTALRAGANESALVTMRPALTSRNNARLSSSHQSS